MSYASLTVSTSSLNVDSLSSSIESVQSRTDCPPFWLPPTPNQLGWNLLGPTSTTTPGPANASSNNAGKISCSPVVGVNGLASMHDSSRHSARRR